MEKIQIINRVINYGPLSKRVVKNLSNNDREYLIKTPKGYLPKDIDALFSRGCDLRLQGDYHHATRAFTLCTYVDPNHYASNIALATDDCFYDDYIKLLAHIRFLKDSPNEAYNRDYNFYLLLISHLFELDDESKKTVEALGFEDILISPNDCRYSDLDLHNEFRERVFRRQFNTAAKVFKKIIKNAPTAKENNLIEKLFRKITDIYRGRFSKIRQYIEEGSYDALVRLLTKEKPSLLTTEKKILSLAQDIVLMNKTGILLFPSDSKTTNESKMIEEKQYDKAYIYNLVFVYSKGDLHKSDILSKILLDVIKVRNSLKGTPQSIDYAKEIYENLLKGDYDTAYTLLYAYLETFNLEKFYYYVKALIEVDIINSPLKFENSMHSLGDVVTGIINLNKIVGMIEQAIQNKQSAVVKKLLELIEEIMSRKDIPKLPLEVIIKLPKFYDFLDKHSEESPLAESHYAIKPVTPSTELK